MSIKIISHHLKNLFLKTNLSQSMKEISKTLAAEMNKILNSVSPAIMKDIFKTETNYYNTRNALIFSKRNTDQVLHML